MNIKKLLIVLCILALMIGAVSVTAAALEDITVATVNGIPYTSLQKAVDAVKDGTEIKLQKDTTEDIEVNWDVYVDLNGNDIKSVTVNAGTFYGTDTQTCDFESKNADDYGIIGTIEGNVQAEYSPEEGGYGWLIFSDNGKNASFHYVELRITDMLLRPQNENEELCNPSLYYKCAFKGDEVVAKNVKYFGVALSIQETPTAENLKTKCGYSAFTEFQPGENGNAGQNTGTLLKGILKESNPTLINNRNAKFPICGRAYICLTGDRYIFGNSESRSFKEQVELFDSDWNERSGTEQTGAITMYEKYKKVMESWELPNLYEEGVLKVLMIGQSLAQDTVWFLYDVMKAEHPDKQFVVADLYESTTLANHHKYMENDTEIYTYYKFIETGMVKEDDVSVSYGLKDEKWDIIIFNEATYESTQAAEYTDGDHAFVIQYIKDNAAPGYKLAYNATWALPTDDLLWDSTRRSVAEGVHERFAEKFSGSRNEYYKCTVDNIKTYIETDDEFDYVFHTGTTIQYASETYGVPEADTERNYDLYRDYVHASDFGRLMVAYQVYAQIFELDKLESVNVDIIKTDMRVSSREQAFGDLQITQQHKDAIIACVNYALANPNAIPEQVYREPAFLERPDLMTEAK